MRNKQRQLKIKEKNKKGFKSTDLPNKINAKATGDLTGNKWANKITGIVLTKSKSKEIPKEREFKERSIKIPNKSYISLQKDTKSY